MALCRSPKVPISSIAVKIIRSLRAMLLCIATILVVLAGVGRCAVAQLPTTTSRPGGKASTGVQDFGDTDERAARAWLVEFSELAEKQYSAWVEANWNFNVNMTEHNNKQLVGKLLAKVHFFATHKLPNVIRISMDVASIYLTLIDSPVTPSKTLLCKSVERSTYREHHRRRLCYKTQHNKIHP